MATAEMPPSLPLLARYALLVDVGYLYAASGQLLYGVTTRRDFRVHAEGLIQALQEHAATRLHGELLRVYWYDAARNRVPTIDQRVIAQLSDVKLRLGNLNANGQQKGVDAQIRVDLEELARYRAVTDTVLLAGDEDTVPAVEAAQACGVRVHLWAVEPPYGTNQAERLVWESDTVDTLDADFLRPHFEYVGGQQHHAEPAPSQAGLAETSAPSPAQLFGDRAQPKPHPRTPAGTGAVDKQAGADNTPGPDQGHVREVGEHVAQKWILTRGEDNIRDLLPGPMLPPVIDKELLVDAEKELGYSLRLYQEAREWLRYGFWARVYREFDVRYGLSAD